MRKKIGIIFILAVISFTASAQGTGNISGKLKDSRSNPVARATVYLLNTNYSAISNDFGEFRINNIRAGTYTMHLHAIGFASIHIEITIAAGSTEEISLILQDEANHLSHYYFLNRAKYLELQNYCKNISAHSRRELSEIPMITGPQTSNIKLPTWITVTFTSPTKK